MTPDWSVRVDGQRCGVPAAAEGRLSELARAAGGPMCCAEPILFLDARAVGGRTIITMAIGPLHAPIRAQRGGVSFDDALRQCCDSIASRLAYHSAHVASLTERPAVGESLLRTWLIPVGSGALTPEDRERAVDEQFVYQLSNVEARIRAELSGDWFYVYGARGHSIMHALLRVNSAWYRLEHVERPVWQLPLEDRSHVEVRLDPVDTAGPPIEVTVTRDHLKAVATVSSAAALIDVLAPPLLSGSVAELGAPAFLARESAHWIRALSYESDVERIGADTGPFGVPLWARRRERREGRAARLRAVLACPGCRAPLGSALDQGGCPGCGRTFTVSGDIVSFGDRPAAAVVNDPGASRNTPSKQLVHGVRLHQDGLVLNVGAGDCSITADNLINLEICRYPATDVVGDAAALPFVDGAFDMVFSQSVLEHVRDPFTCAREMDRVLTSGGTLHADAPFIASFHGYPDHYFNISMNGLRQLFAGLHEIDVREGPHHAPSIALLDILGRFCTMIREPDARNAILAVTVRELFDLLQTGRHPEITRDLDPSQTFQISAGFTFYGMKRRP